MKHTKKVCVVTSSPNFILIETGCVENVWQMSAGSGFCYCFCCWWCYDVKLVPAAGQWSMVFNNWMMSMADFLNNGIESMNFVRCVIDNAFCAIRLHQAVWAFDLIAMAVFPCLFVITRMQILYGISKLVIGWSLEMIEKHGCFIELLSHICTNSKARKPFHILSPM